MSTPRHVQVSGPLGPYRSGFHDDLVRQGYRSTHHHLYVMAQMSRWLCSEKLSASELSTTSIAPFATWRTTVGYTTTLSTLRVSALVGYLIDVGAMSAGEPVPPDTTSGQILERYRSYLTDERGLAAMSIRNYIAVADTFLSSLGLASLDRETELAETTTAMVSAFVLEQCQRGKVASAKAMTTRLRSFLRYLYLEGLTPTPLVGAVPTVASWRQASLPKALARGEVLRLLKNCDRRTAVGRRDYAVLTILLRLGLRAAEVAGLCLGDIDWRHGELLVHGKGNRKDRLPLPSDVGEAIVSWLCRGRPRCDDPPVFTRVRPPLRALSSRGISMIVYRACDRAGLTPVGAHRLRHTVATEMLRAGAGLGEVGQILRHRSNDVTSIYAKVDWRSLVVVVRPWPGER